MNVLVYTGEGAARTSLDHAFFSLQQVLGHQYAIIPVTSQTLRHEPWEANAALLVMPGGRDLPYVRDLQGEANARIKRYVQRGGRYLGLCAGGYYGSARIEFEKGTPLSVCGPRDLGFFPGLCRGVAYPGFVYSSEQGARAIEVQPAWDEMPSHRLVSPPDSNDSHQSTTKEHDHLPLRFRVYYNGGGYFVDAHKHAATVDTLVSYTVDQHGAPWKHAAAVVGCRVGQGAAVLSGIHPEYSPSLLSPSDYQRAEPGLVARLEHDDPARLLLWKSILAYLGLKISATNHAVPATTPLLMCGSPYLGPSTRAPANDHRALFRLLEQEAAKHDHRVLQDLEYGFFISRFSPTLYALLASTATHQEPAGHTLAQSPGRSPRTYATHSSQALDPTPQSLERLLKELAVTPSVPANKLVPEGAIPLMLCDDVPDSTVTPRFSLPDFFRYQSQLGAHIMGKYMLYAQTATSTQTILDKNPQLTSYLPDGLVCLASQQIKGRGRGRNPWISPDGCLQFSLLLKYPQFGPNPQASPVLLQYLFGLAVVEAVRSCPGYEEIPLWLKWPNDVYAEIPVRSNPLATDPASPKVRRVKISGTLTNSSFGKDGLTLVIGTGVNCHNALPTTSVNELIREYNRQHGTSLPIWSEELLLARILAQFEVFYQRFLLNQTNCTPFTPRTTTAPVASVLPTPGRVQTEAKPSPREVAYQRHSLTSSASLAYPTLGGAGIEPFLAMYYRRWLHSDQLVTLQDHDHVQVRIKGITTDYGYLETIGVRDGQRYVLQPGGNSFDMMAGLIGRKKV